MNAAPGQEENPFMWTNQLKTKQNKQIKERTTARRKKKSLQKEKNTSPPTYG